MKKLSLLLLLSLGLQAEVNDNDPWNIDYRRDEINPTRAREYRETLLAEEQLISTQESEDGTPLSQYYTGHDSFKLALQYHTTAKFQDASSHTQMGVELSKRFGEDVWYSIIVQSITTEFQNIADNKTENNNAGATSEENFARPEGTSETLLVGGIGAGYRFKAPFESWAERGWFQTADAYLTYNTLDESLRSETYKGFGLMAHYGFGKRVGKYFQYGAKLGYNFAYVKRSEQVESENSDDQTLMLSWFSAGIDFSFFF